MVEVDDMYVVQGPEPSYPVPKTTLGETFYDTLISAPAENIAMVDVFTGNTMTYSELLQNCCNFAEALRTFDNDTKRVVGICSENCLEYFMIVVGTQFNSTPIAFFNPNSTETELERTLDIVTPSMVFSSASCVSKLLSIRARKRSYLKTIQAINTEPINYQSLHDFVCKYGGMPKTPKEFRVKKVEPKANPAFILFSSGTTGWPKAVMLSHLNLNLMLAETSPTSTYYNELGIMPFHHSFGLQGGLRTLKAHNQLLVFKKFHEDLFLKTIQDYKIEYLELPPTVAVMLAKSPKIKNYNLSHVKDIVVSSAPLKEETELQIIKRFGKINTWQAYGMTELTSAVTYGINKPGSIGKLVPYISGIVRDPENGRKMGPFQRGELCFKGPLLMLGYYNNEQATKDIFTSDGWLKTGDIGYYDNEGYFYIVDRMKELIKYKGHQVAPAELEATLLSHPEIKEAGVVGVPDERCGELPLAFVVKEEGSDIRDVEVQQYIAEKVSSYKRLKGGVIFLSDIPKTPVGKIQRKKLKEMALKYYPSIKSKL